MILVTGAGGNVGREVVRGLSAAGVNFRAGYYTKDKAAAGKGVENVVIDFARPETLAPALKGVERVFIISNQPPLEQNVVREAKRAGVRHIVKSSVWGAPGEAFSFARQHRPVEKEIEASGIPFTFLRPNGFMQNITNFYAGSIKAQGTFYLAAADARVSHIDVRDIGRVAVRVLTEKGHEGKAYDLSGPEALTYSQIAEILSNVLGKKVFYVALSDADFKKGMTDSGAPPSVADATLDLLHYYIGGQASRVSPAVRELTGRDPGSFEQFARDHIQLLR